MEHSELVHLHVNKNAVSNEHNNKKYPDVNKQVRYVLHWPLFASEYQSVCKGSICLGILQYVTILNGLIFKC